MRLLRTLRRAAPALTADERRFARGTRTVADLVAPAAFEVARDHVRADHHYARTLVVTGYPRSVGPGWLAPLVDFDEPLELSVHVDPLESVGMVRSLTHKMVQLHSSRLLADRGGRLADPEREVAYEDAERLRDALQRGEERVFSVGLYVLVRAPTKTALDDLTRRVETTLDGLLAHSRVAVFEQDAGFRSCLPQGADELRVHRNLDTSSLATCFPFASASPSTEHGVLYGVALHTSAPIVLDPFADALENANMVVCATSGAGKSFFTKVAALRLMLLGVDFLVVDPEGEYGPLCRAVGGQTVRLGVGSPDRINPFDLPPPDPDDAEGRDPVRERVAALVGLLGVILAEEGRPLGPRERALLDRALRATYRAAGITDDPATHGRPAPLLADLVAELAGGAGELAADLALRLGPYVDGALRGLFAGQTTVALDRSFVQFDLRDLDPQLRPLAVHEVASFVWTLARRSRRPRLLDVDECWTLVQHADGGAALAAMARRFRKHYMGLACVTQDVADFLGSAHGRTILANSAVKLLMRQDPSAIDRVVETFRLTAAERQLLLGAGKGEGLLLARGSRVALRVQASPTEYKLATTAPHELAEMAAAAGGAR